jgi:hypothetical protein
MPTTKARDYIEIYDKDCGTGRPAVFSDGWPLSADAWRRCILAILVLCSTVLLGTATANARELPASASNAAIPPSGSWSPVTAESATAPRLPIRIAELAAFEAFGSYRTSPAQLTTYRLTESMDDRGDRLQYSGSTPGARVAKPSLLADPASLPPESLLSFLQARYTMWESSMADSRSLINVNGVSVYPLFQINYAGWHLPVTLYISSPRDSDAQ